eukprot:TRINITY_DN63903_c0_g1_i1.p2 TRINITY_DN63903_c0_g1~~TRINITY_DN63903_c0_g1_i1.p2  ORF type:complete len:102 (+),score=43.58 TRINITY_DN63903_c0_g1_i1:204-509(+)
MCIRDRFNTGARGGRGGGNKNEDFAPLVDKKLANDKAAPSSSNNGDTTTTITAVATNFELQTFVPPGVPRSVSYTHLRAHETPEHLVCRLLLEKKKKKKKK